LSPSKIEPTRLAAPSCSAVLVNSAADGAASLGNLLVRSQCDGVSRCIPIQLRHRSSIGRRSHGRSHIQHVKKSPAGGNAGFFVPKTSARIARQASVCDQTLSFDGQASGSARAREHGSDRLTTAVEVRRYGRKAMEFRRPLALKRNESGSKEAQRHQRSHTARASTQNSTMDV